jgi:hypothetical protein
VYQIWYSAKEKITVLQKITHKFNQSIIVNFYEIWIYHGAEYQQYGLLGYDTV